MANHMMMPGSSSLEMTDIINILIRYKCAYQVEFGFICEYKIVLWDDVNPQLCEYGWSFATCPCRWK